MSHPRRARRSEDSPGGACRSPQSAGRIYRVVASIFVLALVFLPVANAMAAPRRGGTLPLALVDQVATLVLIGSAILTLVLVLREPRGVRFPSTVGWFLGLFGWLSFRYLGEGDLESSRNTILIMLCGLAIAAAASRGVDVLSAARTGFRIVGVVSVIFWLAVPDWFINASEYFLGSGKLVAELPNSQGMLSHPNYTGLYFSIALVLEVFLRRRNGASAGLFIGCFAVLLLSTQARSAIIGTALALVVMRLQSTRYLRAVRATLAASFGLSLIPGCFILSAYVTGQRPDFSSLALLGTRQGLWEGVAPVIQREPLVGQGLSGIQEVRRFVTDPDVLFVTHAHNEVLTLALAGGLTAVALYVAFSASIVASVGSAPLAPMGGLAALLFMSSLSESPLADFLPQAGTILTVLLIGAAVTQRRFADLPLREIGEPSALHLRSRR